MPKMLYTGQVPLNPTMAMMAPSPRATHLNVPVANPASAAPIKPMPTAVRTTRSSDPTLTFMFFIFKLRIYTKSMAIRSDFK